MGEYLYRYLKSISLSKLSPFKLFCSSLFKLFIASSPFNSSPFKLFHSSPFNYIPVYFPLHSFTSPVYLYECCRDLFIVRKFILWMYSSFLRQRPLIFICWFWLFIRRYSPENYMLIDAKNAKNAMSFVLETTLIVCLISYRPVP